MSERPYVVVGEEAYTMEEWAALEQRRKVAELRAYKREWMRAKRLHSRAPVLLASLHDLGCSGPTRDTGCTCRKIKLYAKDGR